MYQLTTNTCIMRQDGACIPADPANADYQVYLTWVAAGNTPTPVPETTLQQAQTNQLNKFSMAAANAYIAGFTSTATGTALWYDSDADTQTVINRQYLIALSNPTVYSATTFFAGAPVGTTPVRAKANQTAADSAKTVQYLNAVQMVQLGNDLASAWSAVKAHLWAQQAAVNLATTVEAVLAITW